MSAAKQLPFTSVWDDGDLLTEADRLLFEVIAKNERRRGAELTEAAFAEICLHGTARNFADADEQSEPHAFARAVAVRKLHRAALIWVRSLMLASEHGMIAGCPEARRTTLLNLDILLAEVG